MAIRLHGKTIGYGTPAPFAIRRRHESPKTGDTQSAIIRASGGALDINQQNIYFSALKKTLSCSGHWETLKKNGITHCKIGNHPLRRITRAEYKKYPTMQTWVNGHGGDVEALNQLRKRGGRRTKIGKKRVRAINDYPMTWWQQVKFAERCDTALTPEMKDWSKIQEVADYMKWVCKHFNYPLWPMALLKMKFCEQKCAAFRENHDQFALIFGKFTFMARGANKIKNWKYKPTRIWGPASARHWLHS